MHQNLGIDATTAQLLQVPLTVLTAAVLGYLALSVVAAIAIRRWADAFRFERLPGLATEIESNARRLAVVEVARCGIRRDYARVSRAAADTLEAATAAGSAVAKDFGQETLQSAEADIALDAGEPPYRSIVGSGGLLAGTDAGGNLSDLSVVRNSVASNVRGGPCRGHS